MPIARAVAPDAAKVVDRESLELGAGLVMTTELGKPPDEPAAPGEAVRVRVEKGTDHVDDLVEPALLAPEKKELRVVGVEDGVRFRPLPELERPPGQRLDFVDPALEEGEHSFDHGQQGAAERLADHPSPRASLPLHGLDVAGLEKLRGASGPAEGGEPRLPALVGQTDHLAGLLETLLEIVGTPGRPLREVEDMRERAAIADPARHRDRLAGESDLPVVNRGEGERGRKLGHDNRPERGVARTQMLERLFEDLDLLRVGIDLKITEGARQTERGPREELRLAETLGEKRGLVKGIAGLRPAGGILDDLAELEKALAA